MRSLFALIFSLFVAQSPCFAEEPVYPIKVTVKTHYDPGKIEYRYKYGNLAEVCGHPQAAGCTHPIYTGYPVFQIRPDGTVDIDLYFIFKPFLIDVSTQFKPNTCEFDQILKHELTHVALCRKTMEKYKTFIAAEVLTVAQNRRFLPWAVFQRAIRQAFDAAFKNFQKELDRQNALLDGPEHYDYQWKHNCH